MATTAQPEARGGAEIPLRSESSRNKHFLSGDAIGDVLLPPPPSCRLSFLFLRNQIDSA